MTTMERAFELARASTCASITDIKKRLAAEGYAMDQIEGRSLKRQLTALLTSRRTI